MSTPKNIPVALIIFNRPKETREVFAQIRAWAPEKLYIIADAPRKGSIQDEVRCKAARAVIDNGVDWPCSVTKLYAEENMGCGRRTVSGLDTVFQHEDCAIILDDDCVPDLSFFQFASELLVRYADTPEVMHICGNTWDLSHLPKGNHDDYFFSKFPLSWGLATWRRAWKHMRWNAPEWAQRRKDDDFFAPFHYKSEKLRMKKHWDTLFLGEKGRKSSQTLDTWDYQWHYAMLKQGGVSIVPIKNLIVNIGCNLGATHTQAGEIKAHSYARETQTFPLRHPKEIKVNEHYDAVHVKLNADFYATKINFGECIKSPLRKLKRLLLALSTRLNPKIKNACKDRSQKIAQAFPDFKEINAFPSKYSIYYALNLIQQANPKHILELGAGQASLHLLSKTSEMPGAPKVSIITHDSGDAARVQSAIAHFSQEKTASCLHAPLEEIAYSLDGSFWYSNAGVDEFLKAKPPVDFLWIHGPFDLYSRSSVPLYTAIPALKPHLAAHCTIIIATSNISDAVFLREELRKADGLHFENRHAQYGCLIYTQ